MSEKINEKVINIFNKHRKNNQVQTGEKMKYFAGFNYVKLSEDANGYPFKEENLLEYSKDCHYIVKVMRKINKKVYLYNYNVHGEKLLDFLLMFRNKELDGAVIEIDKFIPQDLA